MSIRTLRNICDKLGVSAEFMLARSMYVVIGKEEVLKNIATKINKTN